MALVSLALVALCISFLQLSSGQPTPTKPVLSESFSVRLTRVGAGQEASTELYRDYEGGKQRQVERLGAGKTVDGSINIILDVKTKKEYQYFQPYEYCASVSVPSIKLLPQWAFVTLAKYKESTTFNQMKVDVWSYNDTKTNIYYELGVSTDTPQAPVFLFEDEAGFAFGITTFEEYTNGAPGATKFVVPAICKEKPAWFHPNTPARNYTGISAFQRLTPQCHV